MKLLRELAEEYDIALTDEMLARFDIYQRLLLEWNERMNLTAITTAGEITEKHFLDSLTLLKVFKIPDNSSLIDVGTGAGFPGVPIKIARPDIRLALLDSRGKKTAFLKELSRALGQDDNLFYHARAEDASHDPALRESFDVATARAVAPLPVLCEYCLPFVRMGGAFLAMKGPDCTGELKDAASAISILGGSVEEVLEEHLPVAGSRTIIIIRKKSQTPAKYPRSPAQMTKAPL